MVHETSSGAPARTLQAFVELSRRLGIDMTVEDLTRSYVIGETGPDDRLLTAIARDIGLEARVVSMRWRELARLQKVLPAIVRLKDGAALVLERMQEDDSAGFRIVLSDPTLSQDALVVVDEAQLRDVWDGDVILVRRRFGLTDEQQPFGVSWLIGQVLHERTIVKDIAAAAFFSTIFALAPAFMFKIVIDRVLVNHSYSTLNIVVAAIFVMIAFETLLEWLRRHLLEIATLRIDAHLNLYIMEKILKLSIDYFEKNPTGMITTKLLRVRQIRAFLTGQLFGSFLEMIPFVGLIPVMLLLEWHLSLAVFGMGGMIFLVVYLFQKPLNRKWREVVFAEHAKGAHLVETLQGMRTIKSLAIEGRRRHEWDGLVARAANAWHEMAVLANYPRTAAIPFERLMYSGSMVLGAYILLASPNSMYAGSLVAFVMLSRRLCSPLVQFAYMQQDLGEVRGAINELASVMNAPPEQTRSGTGLRLAIAGDIAFQGVRFRYAQDAPFALDDVSFQVPQGTMFGIMGRSGSGKTTVTRLLQSLHPNYEGIIKIDGMDLREIDIAHLRTKVGVVLQENFLFSGTIRENIAMARSGATMVDVVRAAQLAGAEEFIERMPRGYETYLQEGAVNLSGGQRQRLAIARALLIEPPVLILDEATSALDAESEAIINANLMKIARNRTIICISHRLSMLVPADAILVLERGRFYDVGSHDELLHRCDIYKHLWYQQNRFTDRNSSHAPVAIANVP